MQIITDKSQYSEIWQKHNLHVLQSWEWGQLRASSSNWQPLRLQIGDLPLTIFVRSVPTVGKLGYIPRLSLSDFDLTELTEQLKSIAIENDISLLLIDPNWPVGKYPIPTGVKLTHQIQPQYTNQVQLANKSVDQLWLNLKSKYRRNINKARRSGVIIDVITKEDDYTLAALDSFYELMKSVAASTDFVLVGKEYFRELWEILGAENMARIYLARLESGEVVGSYLVASDGSGAYELYGGVNNEGRNLEAGYLLKWEAMIDAQSQGKQVYDHWGIAPFHYHDDAIVYERRHPLARISEFKAGFGGELIALEQQLAIAIKPNAYRYYQLLDKVKSAVLIFKKRL